uniref:DNA methyltransferase n=1 Tax=Klebsiella phage FKP3 TaxID=3231233 RepID=A0AAU8HZ45_9CAUD
MKGDCLERMKEIPDGSVDMILCDPPYGTTACKWDTVIPFEPMWEQLKRVIKPNGAIVLFGSEPFSSMLRVSNITMFKYDWIWNKNKGSGHLNAKRMPMKYHENISVFYSKPCNYNSQDSSGHKPMNYARNKQNNINGKHKSVINNKGTTKRKPRSVLEFSVVNNDGTTDGGKFHPTQKPVALLEYLIKTYTQEGESVLDFTMGSGSTGVACMNTDRKFIGIELDDTYYQIAKDRILSNEP